MGVASARSDSLRIRCNRCFFNRVRWYPQRRYIPPNLTLGKSSAKEQGILPDPAGAQKLVFTEIEPRIFLAHFTEFSTVADINARQAEYYAEKIRKAADKYPGQKINIINDTRKISDQVLSLSNQARKQYLDAYSHPQIGRVAMLGFGPWLKGFIIILANMANRTSRTAFFENNEEALTWIKQEDSAS